MNIITKKVRLAHQFIGTRITVQVPDTLTFKIRSAVLAEGCGQVTVDWGDGSTPEVFTNNISGAEHAYPMAGVYVIRVSDEVRQISLGGTTEDSEYTLIYAPMVLAVVSNAEELTNIAVYGFRGCAQMTRFDAACAGLDSIAGAAFRGCVNLEGEIYFPKVSDLRGATESLSPFLDCKKITAIHFSEANEAAIIDSPAYKKDPMLGTGVTDVCRFDL